MKAGTTTLAGLLASHPDVFIFPDKEVHFFDRHFDRGVDWYREQFGGATTERAVGEATGAYMRKDEVVARMASVVPEAKLLAVLRDPVDRAYSHYWMLRSKWGIGHTFEELVREEIAGRRLPPPLSHARLLDFGRYVPQLESLCAHFPRESLHVLLFEDLTDDRADSYAGVCRFIGVDDAHVPQEAERVWNKTTGLRSERLRRGMLRAGAFRRAPRLAAAIDRLNRTESYPRMDSGIRRELVEWYADEISALSAWLGRDLSAWRT